MGLATNLSGGEHAYQFIIGNTKVPLFYMPSQNPSLIELKLLVDKHLNIGVNSQQ